MVGTPQVPQGMTRGWAQYSVLLRDRAQRDGAQQFLKARGIPSMIYYPRGIHQQTAYAHKQFPDAWYPNTLAACERVLALPMHPYLTQEDIQAVVSALKAYLG